MDTLDHDLDLGIEEALAEMAALDQSVTEVAAMHLEGAIDQERRALAAEMAGRAAATRLDERRRELIRAHHEAMEKLAVDIEAVTARTRREVDTARRLAAASRAAAEALSQ